MKSNRLEIRGLSIAREGAVLIPPLDYQLTAGDLLIVEGRDASG